MSRRWRRKSLRRRKKKSRLDTHWCSPPRRISGARSTTLKKKQRSDWRIAQGNRSTWSGSTLSANRNSTTKIFSQVNLLYSTRLWVISGLYMTHLTRKSYNTLRGFRSPMRILSSKMWSLRSSVATNMTSSSDSIIHQNTREAWRTWCVTFAAKTYTVIKATTTVCRGREALVKPITA